MFPTPYTFKRIFGTLAILFVLGSPPVSARDVDPLSYHYPYADPYLATTTIAIMKGRDQRFGDETIQDMEIALIPGRNDIPLLEGKGNLHFRFYRGQVNAPLIIIVPGLGSSAYEGSANYLGELLVANGFQVMIMPDPLNWNFALAASSTGFPGDHVADARDMYRAMKAALRYLRDYQHVSIGRVGLLGFSEGAFCAAFVDKLDAEQGQINFYTTLLLNPPVDPLSAIRKIDAMAQIGATLTPNQRTHVQAFAFGTGIRALKQDFDDPDYFADWNCRLQMSSQQIQYLIGASMFSAVGDTMYVIELAQNPGVLKTPITPEFRSAALEEARSIGLMGYLQRFLLPRLRVDNPRMTLETLDATTSLKAIGPSLAKSRRIFLMHNRDDILLSPGDIEYLERMFGDRATIYPLGGHLGNLWYPPNKRDIVLHFRRIPSARRPIEDIF